MFVGNRETSKFGETYAGTGVCEDHGASVQADSQMHQQLALPGPLHRPENVKCQV